MRKASRRPAGGEVLGKRGCKLGWRQGKDRDQRGMAERWTGEWAAGR